MTTSAASSLGRMPLHGGWALLRFSTPGAATSPIPGRLATVRHHHGELTLPVYQHGDDTLALLAPPSLAATAPPTRAAVTIALSEQAQPPAPGGEQEAVVLGVDAGLGGALAVAEWLDPAPTLVIVGGSEGVPARPRPSRYLVPQLPPGVIAALPQLEEQGIPSRIALDQWLPGCFDEGPVELLHRYLAELGHDRRERTVLHAFVPDDALDEALPGLRETLAGVHVTGVPAQRNA